MRLTLQQKLVLHDANQRGGYYPTPDESRTVRSLKRRGLVNHVPSSPRIRTTLSGEKIIDAIIRAALTDGEKS